MKAQDSYGTGGAAVKKAKAILIILSLTLIVSGTVAPVAAENAIIRGDTKDVLAGDTLTYAVYVENNPGIAAFIVSVNCNIDGITLLQDNSGEFMVYKGNFCDGGSVFANTSESGGWDVLWFDVKDCAHDGCLFSLDFVIPENTPEGNYPVLITYSENNTVNENGDKVGFDICTGMITVQSKNDESSETNTSNEPMQNSYEDQNNQPNQNSGSESNDIRLPIEVIDNQNETENVRRILLYTIIGIFVLLVILIVFHRARKIK